jgi:hypothetical protein
MCETRGHSEGRNVHELSRPAECQISESSKVYLCNEYALPSAPYGDYLAGFFDCWALRNLSSVPTQK